MAAQTIEIGARVRCTHPRYGCYLRTGVVEKVDNAWTGEGGVLVTVALDLLIGEDNGLVDLRPVELRVIS